MNTINKGLQAINLAAAPVPAVNVNPEACTGYDLCRRFQPMGKRIIVKQPFISNEKDALFAIRVTPLIDHPNTPEFPYNDVVYPMPSQLGSVETHEELPVYCVTYDIPPPLSLISAAYRYWTGSLIYNFRVVSSAISQGYLITGIARNLSATEILKGINVHANKQSYFRYIEGLSDTYQSFMMESYMQSDLSLSRHIKVEVPYNNVTEYRDTYDERRYTSQLATLGEAISSTPYAQDFIVVGIRGATFVGSDIGDLVIELEISAGPDFRLCRLLNIDYAPWNEINTTDFVFPKRAAKQEKKKTESKTKSVKKELRE